MTTISTIAKGTAWMVISAILVKFLGWIYYVILARVVTPAEIGMFYLVLSVVSMITIFSNLGLGGDTVMRYVSYYTGKKYFNYVRSVVKISIRGSTIFSTIFLILVIIFAKDFSNLLHEDNLTSIFYIMAFYLLILNFYTLNLSFLKSRKRLKLASYMVSIQGTGKLIITIIILFVIGFNANSIALGFILSFLLAAIVGSGWVIREYRLLPTSNDVPNKISLLKEMMPFGLTFVAISSVWSIITYTDRIMLGYLIPPEESMSLIGVYSIILGFCSLITIFVGSIGSITLPIIAESYGKDDLSEIKDIVKIAIRWIAIATLPTLLVILSFPKQILGWIYGPSYIIGHLTFIICAIGTFILSLSSPSQYILEATKRLDISVKIFTAGAVLNVVLNYMLIPKYDITGAALASASTYLLLTILLLISANRFIKIRFPNISKILFSGIITLSLLLIINPYVVDLSHTLEDTLFNSLETLFKFFILGLFAGITTLIYLLFLILFRAFEKEDIKLIKAAMRRLNIPKRKIIFMEKLLGGNQ